jgi:glucose-6-phosphate dehydrogenase assembly protein OpcA
MEETIMGTVGTIAPEKILRELDEMWTALSADPTGEGGGALRACSLTLVTLAEESEDFSALGETIAALMPEHPARTVVVRLQGAGERSLSERVFSQCWRPFGQKRQVCCEQVEINASDAALADLPSVILPLAVPDLPLIVWCRSARVAALPEFGAIAAMAQRVILDSKQLPAALEALTLLGGVAAHGARVADLSWTRLTRWRAMLSQVFENRQNLAELPRISKVTVKTNGEPAFSGFYFGAWVMDVLGDIGVHPEFHIESSGDEPSGDLQSIELAAPDWSAELARCDGRLIVSAGGVEQCNPLRPATDYSLMEEELRITGRDASFERALASVRRLLGVEK